MSFSFQVKAKKTPFQVGLKGARAAAGLPCHPARCSHRPLGSCTPPLQRQKELEEEKKKVSRSAHRLGRWQCRWRQRQFRMSNAVACSSKARKAMPVAHAVG